jgi:threonylcarbamoyladenosine tRNA methylthiotransferase MtaB
MPFACIGTDVIVGFPGETEEDFDMTYSFLESLDVNYLHVFPFSERPDTKAVLLKNKVKSIEKTKRSRLLLQMSESKKTGFYALNAGRTENVIFESKNHFGKMFGFTSNYIKVEAPFNKDLIGRVMEIKLKTINLKGNFEVDL